MLYVRYIVNNRENVGLKAINFQINGPVTAFPYQLSTRPGLEFTF
jgi:hypothetical protein